jgi:AAA domain/RepB DNA-primase N-terminal domain
VEDRVERLLAAVWGNRSGYVFLPYKVREADPTKGWHETPGIPYTGAIPSLTEPQGRADQYFCPVVFSEPKRRKEFALPTNVLWADLDPVNPETCRIKPSVAWESSPGRYHALWFLNSDVPPDEAAALSKSIAYADGGDHGGWDLTQVLRIPGTRNYKYDAAPEVKLLWAKSLAYSVEELRGAYPAVNGTPSSTNGLASWPVVPESVIGTAIAALPQGYRTRLFQEPLGDRSTELQKLTRDLVRRGLAPEIVLTLIQRSTWNKFAGRGDEHKQLLRQLESAQAAVALRKEKPKKQQEALQLETIQDMKVHNWSGFMSIPTSLKWLVDDAWVDRTVGFISGRSKSYKTWIALDLALSIVSGVSFLGRYPVRRTGPVLLIQEEDPSSVLQDRLRLVAKSKDMLPRLHRATDNIIEVEYTDYPLHIINLQGFNLGIVDRVAQVRKLIAELNPVMVILDPLIVMLGQGVDEYKANEVSSVLQSVKMWREEFGCSVVIVHHWNKGKNEDGERLAEHMYGSFAFHAWLESALHVMPLIPGPDEEDQRINQVIVEREFKAAPSGRALKLQFNIDTVKTYTYAVEFEDNIKLGAREQAIIDMISQAGPSSTPEIVAATGYRRPDVVEICGRLVRANLLKGRKGGGRNNPTIYWLPDQPPPPSN